MHMVYPVSITSQGQISIPIELRRKFRLDITKKALVEDVGDQIIIKPIRSVASLRGIFQTKKQISASSARKQFEEALAKGEV
jgi:bifunctional DNA-binding transcriptional regulator/antitoxin component of YhaV-PrlF toxin-antitoxin module